MMLYNNCKKSLQKPFSPQHTLTYIILMFTMHYGHWLNDNLWLLLLLLLRLLTLQSQCSIFPLWAAVETWCGNTVGSVKEGGLPKNCPGWNDFPGCSSACFSKLRDRLNPCSECISFSSNLCIQPHLCACA